MELYYCILVFLITTQKQSVVLHTSVSCYADSRSAEVLQFEMKRIKIIRNDNQATWYNNTIMYSRNAEHKLSQQVISSRH